MKEFLIYCNPKCLSYQQRDSREYQNAAREIPKTVALLLHPKSESDNEASSLRLKELAPEYLNFCEPSSRTEPAV
jgi:hypothetical protein